VTLTGDGDSTALLLLLFVLQAQVVRWHEDRVGPLLRCGANVLETDALGQTVLELVLGPWTSETEVDDAVTMSVADRLLAQRTRQASWMPFQYTAMRLVMAGPVDVTRRKQQRHIWWVGFARAAAAHRVAFRDPLAGNLEAAVWLSVGVAAWTRRRSAVVVACWRV